MIEIVQFYFSIMAKIVTDIWAKFEIFDGINYAYWVIGISLFVVTLKILTFSYADDGITTLKGYHHRRQESKKEKEKQA